MRCDLVDYLGAASDILRMSVHCASLTVTTERRPWRTRPEILPAAARP